MKEELQLLLESYIAVNVERESPWDWDDDIGWERRDAKYDQLEEVINDLQRILKK